MKWLTVSLAMGLLGGDTGGTIKIGSITWK